MINKLHPLLYAALLLCSLSVGAAQIENAPFQGVVVEAGIFEVIGPRVDSAASDTAAGKTSELDEIRLIEPTRNVRARLGVTFGIRYRLNNVPNGDIEGLEMRSIHPPITGPDGISRSRSTAPEHAYGGNGRADGFIVYTLSEPFEVVPGRWLIQLLYKGSVVVSQEFLVQ